MHEVMAYKNNDPCNFDAVKFWSETGDVNEAGKEGGREEKVRERKGVLSKNNL